MTISDTVSVTDPQSETAASGRYAKWPRKTIRLERRSCPIDHSLELARPDLADIALANRYFAQRYSVPMTMSVTSAAKVRAIPNAKASEFADLSSGDYFQVLELMPDWAWGRSVTLGVTGYVASSKLVHT